MWNLFRLDAKQRHFPIKARLWNMSPSRFSFIRHTRECFHSYTTEYGNKPLRLLMVVSLATVLRKRAL
jgi:hypothetical protein